MKLLIIEDEPKTLAFLGQGMEENGFAVQRAADGLLGSRLALEGGFDLILLDVMLPGRSGWDIVRDLRAAGCAAPVLLLTARDAVADRVKGLELGADDYLVKPFAFSELLARVRSLLRRAPALRPPSATADLVLGGGDARRGGAPLNLTRQEFLLLTLLVERSGEILSREFIAQKVWDMNFDSDTNIVDVAVRRLRRKVDDPFPVKLIHTARGLGYVLEVRQA